MIYIVRGSYGIGSVDGCGYDAVDKVVRAIDIWAAKYGYKACGKQLQMF